MDNQYEKYEQTAQLLKHIAHPVRICIILGLHRCGGCNVTKMQCGLELPQSTVSTHLAVLRELGVVEATRQGTELTYRLADLRLVEVLRLLGETI
ncbi:Transcriptional regulator, ArsR family [Clostridiaceae bacterium JG1575]|nr:Transcriptional regulator, ArsR family [Clostridiaceae bacterium JG1575]